jgi:sugar/nucleoside kinase (ribokinase family)
MGETFNSNQFKYGPGGKCANACIAASRLSSPCALICKVKGFFLNFF